MRYYTRLLAAASTALIVATGCKRADTTDETAGRTDTATGALAPAAVTVTEIDVGRRIGTDGRITDETDQFAARDTIYASVATGGAAPSATLQARWTFQDGQTVDESSRTIAPTGPAVTEFHISKPSGFPKGKYKVEILLNGASAGTKEFAVK